jgi:dipeptidyl aminopeptidase/acylaminoacyl peptidase
MLLYLGVPLSASAQHPEDPAILIEVAGQSASSDKDDNQVEDDGPTFHNLFRMGVIKNAILSPNGERVAFARENTVMIGNVELGFHEIFIFGSLRLVELQWSGNNILLGSFRGRSTGVQTLHVMEIGEVNGKLEETRHRYHQINGYVFDPLTDSDEEIILAKYVDRGDFVAADLFRFRLFEAPFPQLKFKRRLNKGVKNLSWYLRSSSGEFAAGVSVRDEGLEVWQKPEGKRKWEKVWTAPPDTTFIPVGLSADRQRIWALSNVTTDRIAAVEFSLAAGNITSVLFEHDRFDLSDIILSDDSGEPLAVSYLEQGLNRYEIFSDSSRDVYEAAASLFPGEGVILTDFSQDQNMQIIVVSSPQNPGAVYVCDLDKPECNLIEHTRPWLNGVVLAETAAIEVVSTDGLTIDAFLTLPPNPSQKIPLLVMPHGGPIGVSDDRYYSSDVQWLAMNGYAVLQVNYRGSSGYGKSFRQSGLREWGRGIEEDIEAAISVALSEKEIIDSDRIGIIGASYGGYSALMGVLRNPEVFRCAVSFAGVTDLTLLFNGERVRKNADLRDQLIGMVGDPSVEYEQLVEHSPVYQFRRFTRPILIAHGTSDSVVDVEHSWRLKVMLDIADIDAEFVVLDRVGHGFTYISEAQSFYEPAIEFLDTHLKSGEDYLESNLGQ